MKLTHLVLLLIVGYFLYRWWKGQQAAPGRRSARTGMAA